MVFQGHTGPLCGSCSSTHGRQGPRCRECYPKGLVLFLFFCALLWFLLVVTISIKGNLRSKRHSEETQSRCPVPEARTGSSLEQTLSQVETGEKESALPSVELSLIDFPSPVNVRGRSSVTRHRESSALQLQPGSQSSIASQPISEDFEKTKRAIAETFKVSQPGRLSNQTTCLLS